MNDNAVSDELIAQLLQATFRSKYGLLRNGDDFRFVPTTIKMLSFLHGCRWDTASLAYVMSLQPTRIRIIHRWHDMPVDWVRNRVVVFLDVADRVLDILQDVEIWLPSGFESVADLQADLEG